MDDQLEAVKDSSRRFGIAQTINWITQNGKIDIKTDGSYSVTVTDKQIDQMKEELKWNK